MPIKYYRPCYLCLCSNIISIVCSFCFSRVLFHLSEYNYFLEVEQVVELIGEFVHLVLGPCHSRLSTAPAVDEEIRRQQKYRDPQRAQGHHRHLLNVVEARCVAAHAEGGHHVQVDYLNGRHHLLKVCWPRYRVVECNVSRDCEQTKRGEKWVCVFLPRDTLKSDT